MFNGLLFSDFLTSLIAFIMWYLSFSSVASTSSSKSSCMSILRIAAKKRWFFFIISMPLPKALVG
jgi:hypothetical protein